MKLEKTKRVTKLKKSQLQNEKQVQNVVVNLPAIKSPRKRKPKALKTPTQQGPNKAHFQSPIYMPPVVSYNPKQDNNFLLIKIMKHVKGVSASNTQPNNQIENQVKNKNNQTKYNKLNHHYHKHLIHRHHLNQLNL